MKKLFTLFAFLAVFLGANAKEFTDFTVDYTKVDKSTITWKAGMIQDEWITMDGEGLHLYNPEVTENFWDYQLWIFGGASLEVDVEYTIKIVAKVSDGSAAVRCKVGNWDGGILGTVTVNSTDYQEYTYTGKATTASNGLLVQFGDYVGTVSFKSVTITHEGEEETPPQYGDNILTNGDASGDYGAVACAYAKEFVAGADAQPEPYPATIETVDGEKVFVVHSKAVEPPLLWEEAGEQWGQQHDAGDPMPDNDWQNQFWITLPEGITEGTQLKLSFKVKANKTGLKADLQAHKLPGDYLTGFTPGTINITTDWTTYDNITFAAPAADDGGKKFQSIAFNLSLRTGNQYQEDIDFYFDDLCIQEMVLEHGFFVASANTESGLITYKYDTATQFEYDESEEAWVTTVGTVGNPDSYVNEVMISTVRGNSAAFKSSTIKSDGKTEYIGEDNWGDYVTGSNAKIKLPAGVWKISIDDTQKQFNFLMLEGADPVDIITNTTENVINATERDWKPAKDDGSPQDGEEGIGTGQPWDNQFWIAAKRDLSAGEVTVVKFQYKASKAAHTSAQAHKMGDDGKPCTYLNWQAIDNVDFTEEWQDFEQDFTIPEGSDGMRSIVFNLSEIKDACDYYIKNVQWYLKDETLNAEGKTIENLIKGDDSDFWTKVDKGAPTGIIGVVNDFTNTTGSNVIYNLSGQRVTKDYKGIVIMNGRKVVNK